MYGKSKGKNKLTAKQKTLPSALKKKIMKSNHINDNSNEDIILNKCSSISTRFDQFSL